MEALSSLVCTPHTPLACCIASTPFAHFILVVAQVEGHWQCRRELAVALAVAAAEAQAVATGGAGARGDLEAEAADALRQNTESVTGGSGLPWCRLAM